MAQFKATETDTGVRADIFIASKYPQFTRSSLEKLFEDSLVLIDKKPLKASYRVKLKDKLTVDDKKITAKPPVIELPLIYEDNDVIVMDKPAGLLTHSKGAINDEATVASFIRPKVDDELVGNRAGIVHRLDRDTSGVIIAAKNKTALNWLQKQFSSRKTKKTYLAVVEGLPKTDEAVVDVPLARNPKRPQTFQASNSGKPAQTQYKIIKSFSKNHQTYALVELKPKTGRTHQLRVHMAYIKHPIVGDRVYGSAGPNLLLHAQSLELTLPDRTRKVFTSPLPQYFKEFVDK